jgi:hypothetical protein
MARMPPTGRYPCHDIDILEAVETVAGHLGFSGGEPLAFIFGLNGFLEPCQNSSGLPPTPAGQKSGAVSGGTLSSSGTLSGIILVVAIAIVAVLALACLGTVWLRSRPQSTGLLGFIQGIARGHGARFQPLPQESEAADENGSDGEST